MRKLIAWLLGGALGLECVYLIAANLFLALGGVGYLFKDTNSLNATFERAWTLLPGRVEVRGLRLVFQDHNLQWSLDLPRVEVTLRLTELAQRTFHATHVRAEAVRFHMRHRIDPDSLHAPWLGALPTFPEFPGPAVFEAYVPEPPILDSQYKLWTVHLEDVNVGVSELWVQAFRYQGQGRARGEFLLRPARWLWVEPASLSLEPGTLSVSAYQVARDVRAEITCSVQPFDVRVPIGVDVFRYISTRIALHADAVSPEFLRLFAEPTRTLGNELGTLELALDVKHGLIQPGSQLTFGQLGFELSTAQAALSAEQLELTALALDDGRSEVRVALRNGHFNRPLANGPAPVLASIGLVLDADNLDTTQSFRWRQLRLEHALIELPDARWLSDLLRESQLEVSGQATLRASGRYADLTHSSGQLELVLGDDARIRRRGSSIQVSAPGAALSARLSSSARERTADFTLHAAALRAESGARRLQLSCAASGKLTQAASSAQLQLVASGSLGAASLALGPEQLLRAERGAFQLAFTRDTRNPTDPRGKLSATVSARALVGERGPSDARCRFLSADSGRVALTAELGGREPALLVRAGATRAHVAWGDFSAAGELTLSARIERALWAGSGRASGHVALADAHVTSGSGDGVGWEARAPLLALGYALDVQSNHASANLNLGAESAQGRIGRSKISADLDARVQLASLDLAAHAAHGVADLRIANASLAAGEERVSGWWGNVQLNALKGSATDNLDFSAGYSARVRDASPALAVLTENGSLPRWVAELFPLRDLQVSGSVVRHCRLTDFHVERAAGGPLVSSGRLVSMPSGFQGASLLRLSGLELLAAGLSFDADHVAVSPLVGDGWLAEQNAELDQLAQHCDPPLEDVRASCGE